VKNLKTNNHIENIVVLPLKKKKKKMKYIDNKDSDNMFYTPRKEKNSDYILKKEFDKDKLFSEGIITYDENGKNMIYGGTGENILLQLLNWLLTEPDRLGIFKLVHIYIYCSPLSPTPLQLLQMIIKLWNKDPPTEDYIDYTSKNRSSIMLFLSGWFESQYEEDFNGDVGELLQNFINSMPKEYMTPLLAKFENVKKTVEPSIILFKPSKSKIKVHSNKLINILHIKPSKLAEQWTLMDIRGILSIKKSEFLNPGNNWERMLKRSIMFTRWVASEIVEKSTVSKRVEAYKRFINMGVRFLELKNFNGLMCLWGGLNTISVDRLKKN